MRSFFVYVLHLFLQLSKCGLDGLVKHHA